VNSCGEDVTPLNDYTHRITKQHSGQTSKNQQWKSVLPRMFHTPHLLDLDESLFALLYQAIYRGQK
jgi:hypothetical protein